MSQIPTEIFNPWTKYRQLPKQSQNRITELGEREHIAMKFLNELAFLDATDDEIQPVRDYLNSIDTEKVILLNGSKEMARNSYKEAFGKWVQLNTDKDKNTPKPE